jgi:hypothetical protein
MKKIPKAGITGQQGVNLIERVALDMGSLWHSTGGLEAGLDGFIEFRDPATTEVSSLTLAVQSKATERPFASETETSFTYICAAEDLDYWMQGNQPIVLVVSRPKDNEAYWVAIKDYFADPERRRTRKVIFDKRTDRFDADARNRLLALAVSKDRGTYFAPPPKTETIYSNLLRVARLPAKLYHADLLCSHGGEVRKRLNEAGLRGMDEWAVRRKRIVSVYDLGEGIWKELCDRGTVEEFDPDDWAFSLDADTRSDFVGLLNRSLRAMLSRIDVFFDERLEHYYFASTDDLIQRMVGYRSLARGSKRAVFLGYPKRDGSGEIAYYRHNAFSGRFRQYGGDWFLQIDPTYRFTSDGRRVHPFYESKLKGILAIEKNPAVLGQVAMWADLLSDPEEQSFFTEPAYPHLGFGGLERFESPVGIDEALWLASDESEEAKSAAQQAAESTLFDAMEGF